MSYSLTYCGGIPDFKKTGDVTVACTNSGVEVKMGMFSKVQIPYGSISEISMKTEEQISKDVTLTRLLLVGIFAFGLKKKRKETTYGLIIDYQYGTASTSAVFTGDQVNKAYSELMKKYQKHQSANPKKEPVSSSATPADPYAEVEKLHDLMQKGVITEEEFTAKKRDLLGV